MSESSPSSESSTLMGDRSNGYEYTDHDEKNTRNDVPVLVDDFLAHVRRCKVMLAVVLAISCGVEISLLIGCLNTFGRGGDIAQWRGICHAVAIGLKVCISLGAGKVWV